MDKNLILIYKMIPGINLSKSQYKEITKAGILALVFDTNRTPRNTSWLQTLFLQKCKEVFPRLLDADLQPTFTLDDVNLGEDMYGVSANEQLCNTIIKDYKETLKYYTGNECLFDDVPVCKPDRTSNTWAVGNVRDYLWDGQGDPNDVTYPANTEYNKKKWRGYTKGTVWTDIYTDEIRMNHNLYWRNILIPAHEITHHYSNNDYKFKMVDGVCTDKGTNEYGQEIDKKMTHSDIENRFNFFHTKNPVYINEWTASVCNANLFILHMKAYFDNADQKNKSIYQLHTIHGMLYIVRMLYSLTFTVDHLSEAIVRSYSLDLMKKAKRWTKLDITKAEVTADFVEDMEKILSKDYEPKWANTYFKHISALMFAINFFTDSPDFINDIYSADIWYGTKMDQYKRQVIEEKEWSALEPPRDIAGWIIE